MLFPGTIRASVLNFYQVRSPCADAHYSAELTGNELTIYNQKEGSYLSRFYFYYPGLNLAALILIQFSVLKYTPVFG